MAKEKNFGFENSSFNFEAIQSLGSLLKSM